MKNFKKVFKSYFQSYSGIKKIEDSYKYNELLNNNGIIMEMMNKDYEDPEFRMQIKKATPETKEFINEMMKAFDLIGAKETPLNYKEEFIKMK